MLTRDYLTQVAAPHRLRAVSLTALTTTTISKTSLQAISIFPCVYENLSLSLDV